MSLIKFDKMTKYCIISEIDVCHAIFKDIIIPQKLKTSMENDQDQGQMAVIEKFVQATKQQQLNSCLLPFLNELFISLKQSVLEQRQRLKQFLRHEDEEMRRADKNFRYMIYSAQCDKLEYLLKTYLRIRLKKIQLYCFYFSKNIQEAEKLMSAGQFKFFKKYSQMRFEYYRDNVFKHLLRNYRDFKEVEVLFAKNENESRQKKIFVQTNQSLIELKSPTGNDYVFAEILGNPQHLRHGIDIKVNNVPSQYNEVVMLKTIIYGPLKNIQERFQPGNYRLI